MFLLIMLARSVVKALPTMFHLSFAYKLSDSSRVAHANYSACAEEQGDPH